MARAGDGHRSAGRVAAHRRSRTAAAAAQPERVGWLGIAHAVRHCPQGRLGSLSRRRSSVERGRPLPVAGADTEAPKIRAGKPRRTHPVVTNARDVRPDLRTPPVRPCPRPTPPSACTGARSRRSRRSGAGHLGACAAEPDAAVAPRPPRLADARAAQRGVQQPSPPWAGARPTAGRVSGARRGGAGDRRRDPQAGGPPPAARRG